MHNGRCLCRLLAASSGAAVRARKASAAMRARRAGAAMRARKARRPQASPASGQAITAQRVFGPLSPRDRCMSTLSSTIGPTAVPASATFKGGSPDGKGREEWKVGQREPPHLIRQLTAAIRGRPQPGHRASRAYSQPHAPLADRRQVHRSAGEAGGASTTYIFGFTQSECEATHDNEEIETSTPKLQSKM